MSFYCHDLETAGPGAVEEYQLLHNEPINKERPFVPFNNNVTDRVVALVNNLGDLSECELGGVLVAAVGRAPESRSCAYFLALSWFVQFIIGICLD
jgi:dihydroxyacetone kinase